MCIAACINGGAVRMGLQAGVLGHFLVPLRPLVSSQEPQPRAINMALALHAPGRALFLLLELPRGVDHPLSPTDCTCYSISTILIYPPSLVTMAMGHLLVRTTLVTTCTTPTSNATMASGQCGPPPHDLARQIPTCFIFSRAPASLTIWIHPKLDIKKHGNDIHPPICFLFKCVS